MFRVEFLSEFHLVIKIILIEYIQKVKKIIIIDQKLVSINQIRLIIANSWLPKRLTLKVNPKCESTDDSDQF